MVPPFGEPVSIVSCAVKIVRSGIAGDVDVGIVGLERVVFIAARFMERG
jgi:hypothetical protein